MEPGQAVIVIPARYASTRLPGKPLLCETGKPLIQHTWEAVRGVARTVIATDDRRILDAARAFGAEAMMTRADHASGTDRVAEVAEALPEARWLINVQGDEPDLLADDVAQLLARLEEGAAMATLVFPSSSPDDWNSPHVVKVAAAASGHALYFSRAGIPYARDAGGRPARFLVHLGVYAYSRATLLRLASLPPSPLEQTERLEQLRALEAGIGIAVATAGRRPTGIDTPEDYRRFCQRLAPETV